MEIIKDIFTNMDNPIENLIQELKVIYQKSMEMLQSCKNIDFKIKF